MFRLCIRINKSENNFKRTRNITLPRNTISYDDFNKQYESELLSSNVEFFFDTPETPKTPENCKKTTTNLVKTFSKKLSNTIEEFSSNEHCENECCENGAFSLL